MSAFPRILDALQKAPCQSTLNGGHCDPEPLLMVLNLDTTTLKLPVAPRFRLDVILWVKWMVFNAKKLTLLCCCSVTTQTLPVRLNLYLLTDIQYSQKKWIL